MKIKSLKFFAIRNFNGEVLFDFSETRPITSISGKNGSGKTTIFQSLVLSQKAFFINQLNSVDLELYTNSLNEDFKKYFLKKGSFIEVSFLFDNELPFDCNFQVICTEYSLEKVKWKVECSDEAKNRIKECWNFENPSEIIVFVDSDKHFFETNVTHENISIASRTNNQLLIDTILNPEKLFSNIYQSLINDYLRERLVPAKPKRDIYFIPTKVFLKLLLPNLSISNFSGQQSPNQFVLLAKTSNKASSNFYDIRNFSSGEKTLFYIILFINYVQRIGLLVIDEPENHFHEELLVRFIKTLNEICLSKSHVEVIKNVAIRVNFPLSKTNLREIKKYYENYNLSQIFLLTHSKNLIYNNFVEGSNLYLDNSLKKIEYETVEKTLREIGLSSIYSKVLFVEGATETEYFDLFFNDHNIKVHSLGGCGAVIDTYKKLLPIKKFLKDYHFCFLIDRDTRSEEDIKKIREENPDFFDDHFIVLGKHEFENYLLDAKIFKVIIDNHADSFNHIRNLSLEEISSKIQEIATIEKIHVVRKTVQKKNWEVFDSIKSKLVLKDTPYTNFDTYSTFLDEQFLKFNIPELLKGEFEKNFNSTTESLAEEIWAIKWRELCDGKIVLNKVVNYFSEYLEIKRPRFNIEIKDAITNQSSSFEINGVIDGILKRFS